MPDIAGNASTTTSITVDGVPVNDVLEVNGDHDWVRITLTAGQKVTILVDGVTLDDAYLRVRDSLGNQLAENDDISLGSVRDSRLVFTAPSSGTYYLDIGSFNDTGTGTYQLSVTTWAPPEVVPVSELAAFLSDGYWGGERHHFAATQGSTITVNITALTAPGQTLALEALALWADVTGINFQQVTSGGQITFDDGEEGAFSEATRSNGITTQAHVNVSTAWLTTNGTSLSSYSFQTYVHEIGHALGLGHLGYYNGDATYANDAEFANDVWSTSIMSYFDQQDNSYYSGLGFSRAFAVTPMVADIQAIASLYGLSTTTRTGDTTYGFGNNSGRAVFTAAVGNPITAYTIFDSGGIDTLNYSGFSSNQTINLGVETFSNVGGGIGNVSIAFGTIIENAVGGNGNDFLIGNSAANVLTGGSGFDSLTGGAGNDRFRDTTAGLNTDVITDFSVGDAIIFTNASIGAFSFTFSGQILTFTGGALSLTGGVTGTLVASAASGGGVQLMLQSVVAPIADVRNDFNGDGRSDILWQTTNGQLSNWLGQSNGGFVNNSANSLVAMATNWHVVGTGDFNGDGRDDVLWRNDAGQLTNWLANATGGFASNQANAFYNVTSDWRVAGTGDFNGDGRDDILWRNANGQLTDWLANANGSFTINDSNASSNVPNAWQVVGTGDFNGDGRDDILWRNTAGQLTNWLANAAGGFASNDANAFAVVPTSWTVVGTGDFNGDGRDDILWRNDNGQLTNWLANASGGFSSNDTNAFYNVATSWSVVGTDDYNGDGRDDILWRNDNGGLTDWLANASGGFAGNDANAFFTVAPTSHVVSDGAFKGDVRNDFNGDGRSDILWRNDNGQLTNWLANSKGGFASNDANALTTFSVSWQVAGTGDFNGDGRDDIVWRNADGRITNWLATAAGGHVSNDANALSGVPTSWKIVGTGDFNGDGRDDILWRNDGGQLTNWLSNASGGFASNDANAFTVVTMSWQVAGTGDFNGDGRDDILWRNVNGQLTNWLATAAGGFTSNDANAFGSVPNAWQIAGTGDFNGDGRDDILWRNDNGQLTNWLATAAGGFTSNDSNAFSNVPTSWQIVGTGDFNGDGRDDILWRNDNGDLTNWLATAAGGFVGNDANAYYAVPLVWQTQPDDMWN